MIADYSIFDGDTGRIIRTVLCPYEMAVDQLDDGEFLIEGAFDGTEYKVVGGGAVLLTDEEKLPLHYEARAGTYPPMEDITQDANNAELNAYLSDYFYGQVDINQWRVDNYAVLREFFYPDFAAKLDAEVKLSDSAFAAEGQAQLNQYNTDCLAVKTRFPKE